MPTFRCLQLISESVEGRDVPALKEGAYDPSDQRHLISITTPGSTKLQVEDAVVESTEHWYRYIVDTLPMDTSR